MIGQPRKRALWAWIIGGVLIALVAAILGAALLFSRYVRSEDANAESAAREFQTVRARLAGQPPLIELRGAQPPVFHRNETSPKPIVALRGLMYNPADESLQRFKIPIAAVRLLTLGGSVRLIDFGMWGDTRGRLTLDDLGQHGPGLIVDSNGVSVAPLATSDALFGTGAGGAQFLIWTE